MERRQEAGCTLPPITENSKSSKVFSKMRKGFKSRNLRIGFPKITSKISGDSKKALLASDKNFRKWKKLSVCKGF
jgi:hypothetical protein